MEIEGCVIELSDIRIMYSFNESRVDLMETYEADSNGEVWDF